MELTWHRKGDTLVKYHHPTVLTALFVSTCLAFAALAADPPKTAPFPYIRAKAFHILEETTQQESGYFSLNEGLNGKMYVGTAKYGENSFLVEFDPATEKQRIVVDVHKVCDLDAKGYAAQAKIHTRNFTAPSGRIYVGSKQGYRLDKSDKSEYPGGYVMVYDPKTDKTTNLGMPYATEGVIDVVADESRGLMYIVTCEEQHWMLGDIEGKSYRELGPMLTPYATTLIDGKGRANVITKDFKLAQYDPEKDKVTVRPIKVDGELFTRANRSAIPTWNLAADGRTAYLVLMQDPSLIVIDLYSRGRKVKARNFGKMIDGEAPDSRAALSIAPDGRIYVIVRVKNTTGFGKGMLHWLTRCDPITQKIEQLGVLAVSNPDYYPFKTAKELGKKWFHGFHYLPDETLTPLHAHMALIVAHDNTMYVTILYPYTLLRIDQFRTRKR